MEPPWSEHLLCVHLIKVTRKPSASFNHPGSDPSSSSVMATERVVSRSSIPASGGDPLTCHVLESLG